MSRAGFNQSIKCIASTYFDDCDLLVTQRQTQPFLAGLVVAKAIQMKAALWA